MEERYAPAVYNVTNGNNAGPGSLRQAIIDLNATGGDDNDINFQAGLIVITLLDALPTINRNVRVNGPGAQNLTVTRNSEDQFSIFTVGNREVTMSALTITSGTGTGPLFRGGGVLHEGLLTLNNVTFLDNQATRGGAVYSAGTSLTVTECTFSDNSASASGGAIYVERGMVEITLTTITNNQALGAAPGGNGGGIVVDNATVIVTSNSAIQNNTASRDGGGIWVGGGGELRVQGGTEIANNGAGTGFGGGIANGGTLLVENSTVRINTAGSSGGGIANNSVNSTATLNKATINGNTAWTDGGGIFVYGSSTVTVNNSTVEGNITTGHGAGIANLGTLTLRSATIANNWTQGQGGGLFVDQGATATNIGNTIIATNVAEEFPDVFGAVTSQGNNLIGDTNGSNGWVASDRLGIDPGLNPLGNYGGPTQTMTLTANSPARNAGNNALAVGMVDQRGLARIVGGTIDIGAVEMQPTDPGDSGLGGNSAIAIDSGSNPFTSFLAPQSAITPNSTSPARQVASNALLIGTLELRVLGRGDSTKIEIGSLVSESADPNDQVWSVLGNLFEGVSPWW
ncbi:MAG: hypothetical protein L0Y72_26235 [Gemmataceae bacterium]|nr:hypothetical protein [Gemmataceae bacterium]MCI0742547.1 hypothetical protein [Gemmataceae bacterium]